jgi:organic radical activating enzyme
MARESLTVPPIAIFSITNKCNLCCKGCYAQAIRDDTPDALSVSELRGGVSFCVIAGGEPLIRPEILDIVRGFPSLSILSRMASRAWSRFSFVHLRRAEAEPLE